MKYIYFYIYAFIIKIVDSFKPYIEKYIPKKTPDIVKTLSGLLQNIPYISSYNNICNIHKICNKPDNIFLGNTEIKCDIYSENCQEIIIPGFMEHDPKKEALRRFHKSKPSS